jgi:ankyrin repeat protein
MALTPLSVAAFYGLIDVMNHCLVQGHLVTGRNSAEPRPRLFTYIRGGINTAVSCEFTPLYWAVRGGYIEAAKLLLSRKAIANGRESPGYKVASTPFREALRLQSKLMLDLLLSVGVKPEPTDIGAAAAGGKATLVALRSLLDARVEASGLESIRVQSSGTGSTDLIHIRIDSLVSDDSNNLDSYDGFPIHMACAYGCIEAVDMLLGHVININSVDKFGRTALWRAVERQTTEMLQYLLALGADVTIPSKSKYTVLEHAADINNLDAVVLLLEQGADPFARDDSGSTSIHSLVRQYRGSLLYCTESKFDFSVENKVRVLKLMLKRDGDIDIEGHYTKETPLSSAAVNLQDNSGETPLFYAASGGNTEAARLLVEKGALLHIQDQKGNTVLHAATKARKHSASIINYLLEKSAMLGSNPAQSDSAEVSESSEPCQDRHRLIVFKINKAGTLCSMLLNMIISSPSKRYLKPDFLPTPATSNGYVG